MFNRIRGLLWRARDTARDYLHPGHREEVFTRIHSENLWGNAESRSGAGSSIAATASVCDQLPVLWKRYNIRSLVDAPCGDCNWIPPIAATLESYTGVDLVRTIIEANRARHPNLAFLHADLTRDVLPKADAILCRDCFQHLPTRLILSALARFKSSGAQWIFLTTNENVRSYNDIAIGSARPINLQLAPFNFPPPVEKIAEDGEGRYLALWRL
jgi:2-polyprenyl-3-methyl-5-hydroxy-6-metoxy-1,4-benzoquinol methylase